MARIACGIDGSERSLTALRHSAAFASARGYDLTAIYVVDPTAEETMSPTRGRARVARQAAELELKLQPALKAARARWTTVLTEPQESVAEALRRSTAEEGAALLALGSRGASGVQRRVLGGVATTLVGDASIPLMLTGTSVREPGTASGPMLWLSDDAVGGAALARALDGVLGGRGASVQVIHLQPDDTHEPLAGLKFETRISAIRRLLPDGCGVEGRLERVTSHDHVLPRLLEIAGETGASAFALATSSHRLSHRLWGGSTTLRLLEQSPIPLIVVARR